MALKLNSTRNAYEAFEGRNVDAMPRLIADGRVPMNTAQLMQRRLNLRNTTEQDVQSAYMDNYFDTGDAVVYHPDGRVKIVLDSQHLRDLTPETERHSGALVIGKDVYEALEGEEFKKGKLGTVNSDLSREDAKSHPVWQVLARDQALLNDYVDFVFAEGGKRFNYKTMMGVYPSSAQGDKPEMRAWYVYRLEGRSDASGWGNLVGGNCRFLGIAPEALVAPGGGASNVKAYTMADLQALDKVIRGLEGTLHSDMLKPIVDFRKKV